MSFLFPEYLWALWFVLVPIAIHIFDFRKHKTVYFSNVGFIRKVNKETKKKSKLKQRMMLLSRIFTIVFLVIAFAQPIRNYRQLGNTSGDDYLGIYIDNSFSMNSETADGLALENAKQKAIELIRTGAEQTRFTILTNDQYLRHKRFYAKDQAIQFVNEITSSPIAFPMSNALQSLQMVFEREAPKARKDLYLISDFQKNSSNLTELKVDSTVNLNFVYTDVITPNNLYIDSCWFDTPARYFKQKELMYARLVNSSDKQLENIPVRLFLNDTLTAIANVDVEAQSTKIIELRFISDQKGFHNGRIELNDYPITYDNTLYFSYSVNSSVNVLLLDNENGRGRQVFKALFGEDDFINLDVKSEKSLLVSELQSYNMVALNGEVNLTNGLINSFENFVANGGTLLIIPDTSYNYLRYNALLTRLGAANYIDKSFSTVPIDNVNQKHSLYKDVFEKDLENVAFPSAAKRIIIGAGNNASEEVLLRFADNNKALVLSHFNKGKVYTFAFGFDLESTNFSAHELVVPTLYNMALQSIVGGELYYIIGKDEYLDLEADPQLDLSTLTVSSIKQNDIVPRLRKSPEARVQLFLDNLMYPGIYQINGSDKQIRNFALNYSLKESDFDFFTVKEIERIMENKALGDLQIIQTSVNQFTMEMDRINNGRHYWKFFLILGLAFLLAEMLIARFW